MKPVGIARYVLHGTLEERVELLERNRKLIKLRWVYQSVISGTAVLAGLSAHLPLRLIWQYLAITVIVYFVNFLLYVASRPTSASLRYYRILSFCQILLDLVIATIVTMIQGGVEARTAILFVIPIINATMLFGSSTLVTAATMLSALGYTYALVAITYANTNSLNLTELLLPIFFYGMVFVVISRLLVYFHEQSIGQSRDKAYNELLALLSHQMRHPASTISAIVDTVAFDKKLKYDKATARYFEILKKENDRQIHLINNLLEVVSPDKDQEKLQKADIIKIILDSVASEGISHKRSDDIKVSGELGGKVLTPGNTEKLQMVIDNLLDNALRYSQPGKKIELMVMLTSKQVIITISDHGVGILPEHQRQIFKKFGSTSAFDGEVHGAGLGMYVSEKIVRAYGGQLKIKSSAGGGTQATIKLQRIDNG